MPSPPCNLLINRPTPSTISFTVSTRRPLTTLTSRFLHYLALATRVILAASVILILSTKWCLWSTKEEWNHFLPPWLSRSLPGQGARFLAETVWARYLVPVSLGVLWLCARRGYTEESLTTLRTLGVQTSTTSPFYLCTPTTRFIPTTSIQDIFIHEAFRGFEVRFYLAIVVEGEGEGVVVFPTLLPSLSILEQVWRGARSCLYEPKS